MTTKGFTVSHARDAVFEQGLREYFEYRNLGMDKATDGKVVVNVIRAIKGCEATGQPHIHRTEFQMFYVLRGWVEFEYEGQGLVRCEPGTAVYQPPSIRHREMRHSEDLELLEVVMPADFKTEDIASL